MKDTNFLPDYCKLSDILHESAIMLTNHSHTIHTMKISQSIAIIVQIGPWVTIFSVFAKRVLFLMRSLPCIDFAEFISYEVKGTVANNYAYQSFPNNKFVLTTNTSSHRKRFLKNTRMLGSKLSLLQTRKVYRVKTSSTHLFICLDFAIRPIDINYQSRINGLIH